MGKRAGGMENEGGTDEARHGNGRFQMATIKDDLCNTISSPCLDFESLKGRLSVVAECDVV